MLMGDYWWLSSPCSEYPSTLGLDLCLRRALGKVNTQVMLEYLPPWRYKPAYCESQLVTTSLGFLHDEPWKLCVQPIDAYHPPPRSSLPHLQFFNALLIASPWILVPSWSLMMFGHIKIVHRCWKLLCWQSEECMCSRIWSISGRKKRHMAHDLVRFPNPLATEASEAGNLTRQRHPLFESEESWEAKNASNWQHGGALNTGLQLR